jgi:hypothetical protein
MTATVPISPLSLNPLTRDLWGSFDATMIAQLAPLAADPCYSMKFYKAPADNQELLSSAAANGGYATYGLKITPGSIIFGFYLPCVVNTATPWTSVPGSFTVQITDVELEHKWFTEPISSLFLANFKPTFASLVNTNMGSFPNLLTAPYPVTGHGMFKVDIQNTSGDGSQRIELVFGVLEVCDANT